MNTFLEVRDGKVIREIPAERVTVEITEDGPIYIVTCGMTPADRELAEAARLHEWLREVDAVQAPGGYTSMNRVELFSPRIRREASAVLNPLLAPRTVPSRLSR